MSWSIKDLTQARRIITQQRAELNAARALLREVREHGVWSSDNGINFAEASELEARIDSYLDACDTLGGNSEVGS